MQSSLSLQVLVDYYRELLFYGQLAYFSQEAPVMDGSHAFGTAFGQSFAADSRFRKGSEPFCQFFFYCSGSCTLLFIAASRTAIDFRALTPQAMQCLRQSYPWNYVPRG